MHSEKILLVDDEPTIVELCTRFLSGEGFKVKTANNGTAALRLLDEERFDLLLTDIRMRGMSGLELIDEAKKRDQGLAIVVVTGHGTVNMAIESLKLGTLGFVIKPFTKDELLAAVRHATERNHLIKDNLRLRSLLPLFEVNRHFVMTQEKPLFEKIISVARSETQSERASLMLLEDGSNSLRVVAHSGFPKIDRARLSKKIGEGISGTVAKTLKPFIIQGSTDQNPELSDLLESEEIFSSISVPLIGRGSIQISSINTPPERNENLLGVLNVSKCDRNEPPFTETDFEFVNLLAGQASMAIENALLYKELHRGFLNLVKALVASIELKDPFTAGHSDNVSRYASALAEEMGLPKHEVEEIAIGGVLHEIGKIGSSEEILKKESKLTPEEFAVIQEHPENAIRILKKVGLQEGVLKIILHHHERFNGKGYPEGLEKNAIPLGARIIMVADTIDAMTSNRPYRKALPFSKLRSELKANSGKQFDPEVVEAFERLVKKKGTEFFKHQTGAS